MTSGSLTLGGSMSVALGPLGRTSEALGSVNTNGKLAAMCILPFHFHICFFLIAVP